MSEVEQALSQEEIELELLSEARGTRIVVVDDEPATTAMLSALLARWGCADVWATNDSSNVVALCMQLQPDLLVLDLHMPSPDGFEVMAKLRPLISGRDRFPILVLTADVTTDTTRRALRAGAQDFLGKPFDVEEVGLRIGNLLLTRRLQQDLRRHGQLLEERVRARTEEAHAARIEILQRLAAAAEYRDDEAGQHTRRVARTAGLLATQLGLPDHEIELITLAAPLHDIGKIAIPDAILLKPGRLTGEEFEVIKTHVTKGAELLSGSASELLQMAEEIARTHHERWDGRGYVMGLSGEQIPLSGRLVAVADVFDALTHERPYKQAWPVEHAVQEIISNAGSQFDPDVGRAFAELDHQDLLLAPAAPTHHTSHAREPERSSSIAPCRGPSALRSQKGRRGQISTRANLPAHTQR